MCCTAHLLRLASTASEPSMDGALPICSGLLSTAAGSCLSRKMMLSTLATASMGMDMKAGKNDENLKSSLGSPLCVVSGCCWKYRRYSQPAYVPTYMNGRYSVAWCSSTQIGVTSRSTSVGTNCTAREGGREGAVGAQIRVCGHATRPILCRPLSPAAASDHPILSIHPPHLDDDDPS